MLSPKTSWAAQLLDGLATLILRWRGWFVLPQLILAAVCVVVTVKHLRFDLDRNSLVGAEKRYHQIYLRFREDFSSEDDIVAVVESGDPEKNRQFVERLGRRVTAATNLFTEVFYRGDLTTLGPKSLQFLTLEQLDELHEFLVQHRLLIRRLAAVADFNSLFQWINQEFRSALNAPDKTRQPDEIVTALPVLTRVMQQAADSLRETGSPVPPSLETLFAGRAESSGQEYVTFDHGRYYVVSMRAARAEAREEAVTTLRAWVAETQAQISGVNAAITGEPVLEFDEMRQSQLDSTRASVYALLLTAILFTTAYRQISRPLKAMACLLIGLCYTMGFTTLVVGHLNLLTVTFLPILIGLAIDFGIHLLTRYEESLALGAGPEAAVRTALVQTGRGIFTGCFTTAGAFLAMALTDFKGIQEMGLITGGGLLLCLVPMMTMLPVLLLHGQHRINEVKGRARKPSGELSCRTRLQSALFHRPWRVIGLGAALCLLAALFGRRVTFDYNLLNMQSPRLSSVVFEKKLIHAGSKSVVFGVVVADSVGQARELQTRLEQLPAVSGVDSMAAYLDPAESESKLEKILRIKAEAEGIEFPTHASGANVSELSRTLYFTQGYLGAALGAIRQEISSLPPGEPGTAAEELEMLAGTIRGLKEAVVEFRRQLNTGNPQEIALNLGRYEAVFFGEIRAFFAALGQQAVDGGMRVGDLPAALRTRFVGKSGRHLLQVYPTGNLWEHETQKEFVRQLRTVDPDATGTPVQLLEYTTLLRTSYEIAALYALGAIVILTLIHFRRVSVVGLALLPVGIGSLWLLGGMGLLGIPFNPANIMTLPLVIGIGVTNGIHMLTRFAEEAKTDVIANSTGKAVLVSGLTTIAGFGSLIPAGHQGISSLGVVMSVGIGSCMAAALLVLPALATLGVGSGGRADERKPSADNAQATLGREEPR